MLKSTAPFLLSPINGEQTEKERIQFYRIAHRSQIGVSGGESAARTPPKPL